MTAPKLDIEDAWKMSWLNRGEVQASTNCGCYFCLRSFPATEVEDWTDDDSMTALCPHCGYDAVLPEVTDAETLKAANARWFIEPHARHKKLS